jgi:PAS domain S-box-containing protein
MDAIPSTSDLQGSPELFRLLADNLPQLAWIANLDGQIFWFNKRWFDYTGTSAADMRDWGWRKVHHPDRVDDIVARFRSALDSGTPLEAIFPLGGTMANTASS